MGVPLLKKISSWKQLLSKKYWCQIYSFIYTSLCKEFIVMRHNLGHSTEGEALMKHHLLDSTQYIEDLDNFQDDHLILLSCQSSHSFLSRQLDVQCRPTFHVFQDLFSTNVFHNGCNFLVQIDSVFSNAPLLGILPIYNPFSNLGKKIEELSQNFCFPSVFPRHY